MYQSPAESPRQATEPPAVPLLTRGIGVSASSPVAASYTCSVPSSVPWEDCETATSRPSGDGAYQSMVTAPLASIAFGSTRIRSLDGSSRSLSVTRNRCCFGGWYFRAKNRSPPRRTSWYEVASAPRTSRARRRIRS